MKITIFKGLTLCGLSLLLAGVGSAASAQSYRHFPHQEHHARARQAILQQKADYAHAVANGHYRAAERAHLRASAIRHHIRTQREMRHDYRR